MRNVIILSLKIVRYKILYFLIGVFFISVNVQAGETKTRIKLTSKEEIEFMLTMLIPLDHVQLPNINSLSINDYVFEGDNRAVSKIGVEDGSDAFSANLNSEIFRIRQIVRVIPGSEIVQHEDSSGTTRRYDTSSSLVDTYLDTVTNSVVEKLCYRKACAECVDYPFGIPIKVKNMCLSDEAINDMFFKDREAGDDTNDDDDFLKEAIGKADTDSLGVENITATRNKTEFTMVGDPGNSIVKFVPTILTPSISWEINIAIEHVTDNAYAIVVNGEHDGFPGYELSVRRPNGNYNLIYRHDPVTSSKTPLNLSGFKDVNISPKIMVELQ